MPGIVLRSERWEETDLVLAFMALTVGETDARVISTWTTLWCWENGRVTEAGAYALPMSTANCIVFTLYCSKGFLSLQSKKTVSLRSPNYGFAFNFMTVKSVAYHGVTFTGNNCQEPRSSAGKSSAHPKPQAGSLCLFSPQLPGEVLPPALMPPWTCLYSWRFVDQEMNLPFSFQQDVARNGKGRRTGNTLFPFSPSSPPHPPRDLSALSGAPRSLSTPDHIPTCYRPQTPLMTKCLEDVQVYICHKIMDGTFFNVLFTWFIQLSALIQLSTIWCHLIS